MTITYREVGESTEKASLRPIVASIEHELSRLEGGATIEATTRLRELRASWAELVGLLALGPKPEMRECPVCKHWGMRAATRCGSCWTTLSPLAPSGGAAAVAAFDVG